MTVLRPETDRRLRSRSTDDAVNAGELRKGRAQDEPDIIGKGLRALSDGTRQSRGLLAQAVHLPVPYDKPG
ncbi:hypothetical protein GRO01_11720 [Gluconobacter roseus NBRC 3990]|uniref:Uncharacterized protein n=1 Tax=Gluconobacter roseus NBRC 3990 TaxID=1307950 RepID=A0A4Y3M6L6_9PROT|nr:hypothetical protein AA3990_0060 [Gluconobacter roseus NBRC 3990]GEB03596.1 hypothetical protein GRO01_11720 [Gluconobacter roseus NBRC 3990]GLP94051.1 hypothetical protein GCM10007871_20290 [Gluconobacter roseus NBRC 3990]